MPTYSDLVSGSALSAGADDTFASVGTITLKPMPGIIIGAWMNAAENALTAAEAVLTQFNFDLGELGKQNLLLTGPHVGGEAVATQSMGYSGPAVLHPLNIPFKGNERVAITATHHASGTATGGINCQAGLLYSMPPHPPQAWKIAFPGLMGGTGGDSEAIANITANATAITALEIPAFASHVIGFGCAAAQDAAPRTAEDLVLGIDFSASDFPDWSPQEFPFLWKMPNLAGTLVGGGMGMPRVVWPAYIPTHGVGGDIRAETIVNTTMTDAHAVSADVYYA